MMEVSQVAVSAGGRQILSDITFTAAKMTAIVGVNGVGKSTLLRALAGITSPDAGTISVPAGPRAKTIAFVGQDENPPADLSIRDLVELGRLPYRGLFDFGRSAEAAQAIAQVGIEDLQERTLDQLSGGQKRRALLARGLAQDTPILLLDEPTNHLDVHHQLQLLRLLRECGRHVIATIHDLDLAYTHFDKVVLLGNGGVVAEGPPDTVLTPERIAEIFHVPSFVAHGHLILGEKK